MNADKNPDSVEPPGIAPEIELEKEKESSINGQLTTDENNQ